MGRLPDLQQTEPFDTCKLSKANGNRPQRLLHRVSGSTRVVALCPVFQSMSAQGIGNRMVGLVLR